MLYLHYLVWLHGAFYLAELYNSLQSDPQYIADMVRFINSIISCSMANVLLTKNISQEALSACLNKTDEEFTLKLYKDNNTVAHKT